jgi:hypothetical protein
VKTTIKTTLGDLIVSIMESARRYTLDEREACRITGLIVNRILCPVPAVVRPRRIKLNKKARDSLKAVTQCFIQPVRPAVRTRRAII